MRALKRWSPSSGKSYRANDEKTLMIEAREYSSTVEWMLPPSKSHLIRWLVLASCSDGQTRLEFTGMPGEDALSMVRCLRALGIHIVEDNEAWVVSGGVFKRPVSVLHCGNSATTLRLIAPLAAQSGVPVMIDGDENLRARDHSALVEMLRSAGVEVEQGTGPEQLPLKIRGPMSKDSVMVDISKSSQPFSGLLLSSLAIDHEINVECSGDEVSSRYSSLTKDLAEKSGMPTFDGRLIPWRAKTPETVDIPGEASLLMLSKLLSTCHDIEVVCSNAPNEEDSLGNELSDHDIEGVVSIKDCIDIITPLATIMCLKNGGDIKDAAHGRYKESDRITRTVDMLAAFGLKAEETDDGLRISGQQSPSAPEGIIRCHDDHRLFMCAAILATVVGAELDCPQSFRASFPAFLEMLDQP